MEPICTKSSEPSSFLDPTEDPPSGPPPPLDPARQMRDAAQALYEALASGLITKPQNCEDYSNGSAHDFDRCITSRVDHPSLFVKEGKDATAVAPTDPVQGRVGDCALMATLSALAALPNGRALLDHAIRENKNDKGEVTSYTVTLYEERGAWFWKTREPVQITVDPVFAKGHAFAGTDGTHDEIWPLVIEKAFAEYAHGYNVLHQGSSPTEPMQLLTGKPAAAFALESYSAEQLTTDLAAGKLVVLETKRTFASAPPKGVDDRHAYSVASTEMQNGQLYVSLRNPWGCVTEPIAYNKLANWFARVDVGSVP